jgi:hypothetical protein
MICNKRAIKNTSFLEFIGYELSLIYDKCRVLTKYSSYSFLTINLKHIPWPIVMRDGCAGAGLEPARGYNLRGILSPVRF